MTVQSLEQPVRTQQNHTNDGPPPLESGDQLTRAEFERRYTLHPEIKKAELIEGVVYVASLVRIRQHAKPHFNVITWLGAYGAATPGVSGGDNATVRLDLENEPQPDAMLYLEPEVGGHSQIDSDDYLAGSPELVIEIAASSAAYDMNIKRRVYARNGVPEYVVFQVYEQQVTWFVLREHGYEPLLPGDDGILRSEIFPGLWLDPAAFWAGDMLRVIAVAQAGIASPEHQTFVETVTQLLDSR
jgi:Uma2 family endonuclease